MATPFNATEDEVISGINITPLVDVVLVLLIIFMMTAPALYQASMKVRLPKAKTGETTEKTSLNFALTKSGELAFDSKAVTWEELGSRLAALGGSLGEKTAVISADRETPHGTVIRLLDALRQQGLTHFALSVDLPTMQKK